MARILDSSKDALIADALNSALEELGYDAEQNIPALLLVIQEQAQEVSDTEGAIDEAIGILSDAE